MSEWLSEEEFALMLKEHRQHNRVARLARVNESELPESLQRLLDKERALAAEAAEIKDQIPREILPITLRKPPPDATTDIFGRNTIGWYED